MHDRVQEGALLGAAVVNNALWCEAVCGSHGYPGSFGTRVWINADHDLEFYPNAITLCPDATAAETAATRDRSRGYAVKDSFARLDLAPEGMTVLFEAEWIVRAPVPGEPWDTVADARDLARWETAWGPHDNRLFLPGLLADPSCAILACRREGTIIAGAIAYTAAGVTGLANVFGTVLPAAQLWPSVLRATAALRPGLPIVGYEHGASLAAAQQAGCRVLGPLRVWARDPMTRT